jgi:hypothetical protein
MRAADFADAADSFAFDFRDFLIAPLRPNHGGGI